MNALLGRIRLDFRSAEPIYLQLVRQIEELVQQGLLHPGDQLPTVRELAIELRINFSTVARAYRILDERKIISTQRGRGTYIWDEPPGDSAGTLQEEALKALAQRFIEEAVRMGFTVEQACNVFSEQAEQWQIAFQNLKNLDNEKG